jgi:uncharacterized protein YkwD
MYAVPVRPRALWASALLLSSILVLSLLPARQASALEPRARRVSAVELQDSEASFRYLMNSERVGAKRKRLRMNPDLVEVARAQSGDMASSGSLFHNPDLAADLQGVSWSIAGENVGVGGSVESLHDAFMNSAPHRKNIMRKAFRRVGVGVVISDGRIWVTVVFAG